MVFQFQKIPETLKKVLETRMIRQSLCTRLDFFKTRKSVDLIGKRLLAVSSYVGPVDETVDLICTVGNFDTSRKNKIWGNLARPKSKI